MSRGDSSFVVLLLGILLLMVTLVLAKQYLPPDSWWPTLLFLPALLLLLPGQLWLLGAFTESGKFEWAALVMFGLFCALPWAIAARATWSTEYDLIRWTAVVLVALETIVFVVGMTGLPGGSGPPPPPRRKASRLPG
jgi:hypothetical protein